MNKKKAFNISLLFSLPYVGLGTYSLLGMSRSGPYYLENADIGFLLTLPVSFLGFGILFSEKDSFHIVILIQIGVFLLFWYLVYKFLLNRGKN